MKHTGEERGPMIPPFVLLPHVIHTPHIPTYISPAHELNILLPDGYQMSSLSLPVSRYRVRGPCAQWTDLLLRGLLQVPEFGLSQSKAENAQQGNTWDCPSIYFPENVPQGCWKAESDKSLLV